MPDLTAVFVADYGTTTAAVQAAADAAAGATLVFPSAQVYTLTAPLRLPSNVVVVGNQATLRTPNNSTTTNDGLLDITGVSGVDVSGLVFDGNIANQTSWSQWRHAIRVLDSGNVTIHDNTLVNLQGDGIYISHRWETTTPCSSAIDIYGNRFLGAHQNRNGVSLVCARGVKIHANSFSQMTRPDMPASIDMEPNLSSDFLTDIEIYGNTIDGGNGPSYTQSGIVYFDRGAHAPVTNVSVHDNTIFGPQLRYGVVFIGTADSHVTGVTIDSNIISHLNTSATAAGIDIEQALIASATGNTITDIAGWGIFTYQSCVRLSGNTVSNTSLDPVRLEQPSC